MNWRGHTLKTLAPAAFVQAMTTRRRLLLVPGTGWFCAPWNTFAQASRSKRRVAYLVPSTPAAHQHLASIFKSGLHDLGWVEGDTLILDIRYAENDPARVLALTAELLALRPDVFVSTTDREARAAAAATQSIPVVFGVGVDPVGLGLVRSLANPGANVTGLSALLNELNPKRLSLLKEAIPRLKKVGVLFRMGEQSNAAALADLDSAARQIGVTLLPRGVADASDLDAALKSIARGSASAVLNVAHSLFFQHRQRYAELALQHRLALAVNATEMADAGALLSYGADLKEVFKRLAPLVDRILKGANPADIPVEQANVYEFVINLRSARALGIQLPRTIMLQATRVIE